jgi:3(or 17)beta-hydroxysteroid dehydrogenase
MGRLKDKIALITGGAKGLGEADARLFAQEGAFVVIADVDARKGEALARELGAAARFLELDVRSEAAFKGVIDRVVADHKRLDVLVNNAGVVKPGSPESITEDDYRFVMSVCVDGVVFGCKHAIPAIAASGGGSIINISSVASIQGVPYSAGYSAAKGAVEAYTRTVAVHCKMNDLKVRCNSVHPGAFLTPMLDDMLANVAKAGGEASDQFKRRVSGTMGDPADVARLVLFLASDESSYITGQRFVIDNGDGVTPLSARK